MRLLFLILGILLVGFAFSFSRFVGGLFLIVIVLGILISAQKKGQI